MLIEFFYPFVAFPLPVFSEVLGEGEVHCPRLPGACRTAKGEDEERFATGTIACRRRLQPGDRDCPWF
jgi:hypothetical protein